MGFSESLAHCRRVALVANGPRPPQPFLSRHLKFSDMVIACDGAAQVLMDFNLSFDALVGDLDSISKERLDLLPPGVEVVRDPNQDTFDLEKAVNLVWRLAPREVEIRVFGAVGGRLDHTLSNLMLFTRRPETNVRLVDPDFEAFVALPGKDLQDEKNNFRAPAGTPVSLVPFGTVVGVSSQGLKWPLRNLTLASHGQLGSSNAMAESRASIGFISGNLAVLIAREPEPWLGERN